MIEPEEDEREWPPIRPWTCLGCCCEFYIMEPLVPDFCPHCGRKLNPLWPRQDEKEGAD